MLLIFLLFFFAASTIFLTVSYPCIFNLLFLCLASNLLTNVPVEHPRSITFEFFSKKSQKFLDLICDKVDKEVLNY